MRFLDLLQSRRPIDDVRAAARTFRPEVVGISVRNIDNIVHQRLTWHLGDLAAMIAQVREESAAAIVLGGPAISILGSTALARLGADFAVLGEGEVTFPRLLAAMENTRRYDDIPGLCYRNGNGIACAPPVPLARFGASGMEAWVDWPAYERKGGTWAIQTKRGCPLHCSYCAYPVIEGSGCRRRPVTEVVDEIEHVMKTVGPRTFEVVDSTFNVPPEHAEQLCREIIRRGLGVNLTAMGVNPLGASERLFGIMRQAGFNSMMVTPESASDTMLRSLRKGFTAEHVRRTARLVRASGIRSVWFFLLGGPGETRETVEETVSFVERQLDWRRCVVIFMTGVRILPGTDLARSASRDGYVAPDRDLAEPVFYFSPEVSEDWILARINRAIGRCPGIVHAGEEGGSAFERIVDRALYLLGFAPPYWRFLPEILRVPPLPALRRRYPPVGAAKAR